MSSRATSKRKESRNAHNSSSKRVHQQIEDTSIISTPPIEVSRITVERILSKLSSLELKMDQVNTTLSDLADKVSKLDDQMKNESGDQDLISSAVKRIVKELIKIAIYPTQSQFLSKTEEFLSENYSEFYKRVSRKNWISYYENNIFPQLLDKHRSHRGTLSSRIKDTMFAIFGDDQLPPINSSATLEKISIWKKSQEVCNCYKKLNTHMEKILVKLYGPDKEKRSEVQVAFAMALVEEILNPQKNHLKISEVLMQLKIEKYLNKLRNNSYSFLEEEHNPSGERFFHIFQFGGSFGLFGV
ncbi:hypothetical protein C1646_773883 [Rhizophagus diaphanus]|nr:hypothetical protein C1646_773883 [Rhizophagus diaphanus] [Rhizophagus sp. MUCL 43196]